MKKSTFNSSVLAVCAIAFLLAGGAAAWVLTGGFGSQGTKGLAAGGAGGSGSGTLGQGVAGLVAGEELSAERKAIDEWLKGYLHTPTWTIVKEQGPIKDKKGQSYYRMIFRTPSVMGGMSINDWIVRVNEADGPQRASDKNWIGKNRDKIFEGEMPIDDPSDAK